MIKFEHRGNFNITDIFLKKMSELDTLTALKHLADEATSSLAAATPRDSGITADSWGYEITKSDNSWEITWTNSNVVAGVPVVILLQYGHGTGTGGYVVGRDYINPAMQPIFDKITEEAWKVVTSA